MDGAIHATTAEQRVVGGIDDGVNVEGGDVGVDDLDTVRHGGYRWDVAQFRTLESKSPHQARMVI
jgi:hypothetical protein